MTAAPDHHPPEPARFRAEDLTALVEQVAAEAGLYAPATAATVGTAGQHQGAGQGSGTEDPLGYLAAALARIDGEDRRGIRHHGRRPPAAADGHQRDPGGYLYAEPQAGESAGASTAW